MVTASRLHYYACNVENQFHPPVVLIHGAGGNHLYWPPEVRRLPDQRIFALDLPGHGWSEGIGRDCIEDYSQDVQRFMTERQLNAAVLVGHSMGGAIALETARSNPRRVLGLGLIGSGERLHIPPEILLSISREDAFQATIGLIVERSFTAGSSLRMKELAQKRMEEIRHSVLRGDWAACGAFDATGYLDQIICPTLILCGADDRMTTPKCSEYLHENIRGSQLQLFSNAGHMVMLEQPEKVAAALEAFLKSIPYRPGQ